MMWDICIDFDGTCVYHSYPEVGEDIGAIPVLKDLIRCGHNLILFTMRSGTLLQDAVNWFEKNAIPLYGVNENPTQKEWTQSPKAYGHLYIDDAALGIPLKYAEVLSPVNRAYVNWAEVRIILLERDIIWEE